jgi:hypothetical protein
MGIIGNGRLLAKVRTTRIGGLTLCHERQNYNQVDRNRFLGVGFSDKKAGVPVGYRHPASWVMPEKPGGLASHNEATVDFVADNSLAVMGLPTSGSLQIQFTATGIGGLIANGSGVINVTFTATGIVSSIATASGTSNVTFTSSATLGALAGLFGTSNVQVTSTATIGAIGYLAGLSTNETEFSANNLANAVWQALAVNYNDSGTMGAKVNSAASAGDPWSTSLPGTYTGDQAGKILSDVKNKTKLIPGLF